MILAWWVSHRMSGVFTVFSVRPSPLLLLLDIQPQQKVSGRPGLVNIAGLYCIVRSGATWATAWSTRGCSTWRSTSWCSWCWGSPWRWCTPPTGWPPSTCPECWPGPCGPAWSSPRSSCQEPVVGCTLWSRHTWGRWSWTTGRCPTPGSGSAWSVSPRPRTSVSTSTRRQVRDRPHVPTWPCQHRSAGPACQARLLPRPHRRGRGGVAGGSDLSPQSLLGASPEVHLGVLSGWVQVSVSRTYLVLTSLLVLYTLLVSVAVVWNILAVENRADNIIKLLALDCSDFILWFYNKYLFISIIS